MTLFGIPPGAALPLAALCASAIALAVVIYRRLARQNRRLIAAVDNMSQGLCMFDAQTRIVVVNSRYIEMYALSPDVVKPGLPLRELIQARKDTGLFSGDVEAYSKNIIDKMRAGKSISLYVQASDGRIVLAKTIRCRAAAGSPPTRTSPNSAAPRKNAPPLTARSSAAR